MIAVTSIRPTQTIARRSPAEKSKETRAASVETDDPSADEDSVADTMAKPKPKAPKIAANTSPAARMSPGLQAMLTTLKLGGA